MSVGKGFFRHEIGDKKEFLNFHNIPGKDNILSIDMKQMINLSMTYELNSKSMMRFFNYYELGISSIYFVFRNEYKRENIDGILVGEIIYNQIKLYFCINK